MRRTKSARTSLSLLLKRTLNLTPLVSFGFLRALCFFAIRELRKSAFVSFLRFLLVKKGQLFFFKLIEELLPCNFFQTVFAGVTRKIDPQNAGIIVTPGPFDCCRLSSTLLYPFLYFLVICCLLCF